MSTSTLQASSSTPLSRKRLQSKVGVQSNLLHIASSSEHNASTFHRRRTNAPARRLKRYVYCLTASYQGHQLTYMRQFIHRTRILPPLTNSLTKLQLALIFIPQSLQSNAFPTPGGLHSFSVLLGLLLLLLNTLAESGILVQHVT